MFLKVVFKTNKQTGERIMHYRMVESYRIDNTVRHVSILHLGTLESLPSAEQKKLLGKRIGDIIRMKITGAQDLFNFDGDVVVEALAQQFAKEIIEKRKIDVTGLKDYALVDTESLKHNSVKEIGTEWLSMQALNQLNFNGFLISQGFSDEDIKLAYTHIISRAVHPASELATSKWIKQNSAVCDITEFDSSKITKDKLYGICHKLYKVKDELEQHLSSRTNELFDLHDKIMIYDLTNTYYEGRMVNSMLAAFGRSKEKRRDAKLVVLALVINTEGFIKYAHIFEGNMSDSKSLPSIIEKLSSRTSHLNRKPVIVIDSGISGNVNLALLKAQGYQYMCVSRSGMTKFEIDTTSEPVKIQDKKEQPISLQRVIIKGCTDTYIKVHSEAKEAKEHSMSEQFKKRFEQELEKIKASLIKKGGVKAEQPVLIRIGRVKQKYPSIAKHYEIEIKSDKKKVVTELNYKMVTTNKLEGHYLLRTNIETIDEKTQWLIYNTIREVESTFRTLKTDLDLRPIYHKTDEAAKAHLHLGLLAYWIVNTIRYQLKQKGVKHDWQEIKRLMQTQKLVTTEIKGPNQEIQIIKCSEPIKEVATIYKHLDYKQTPFNRKKSVVLAKPIKKNETPIFSTLPPD